jgi:cellobiose-specific phosphotransferase system component IIB
MQEPQIEIILQELRELEGCFETPPDAVGPLLNSANRAKFKRLVLEAKGLVDSSLGINDFGVPLLGMQNLPSYGVFSPPSLDQLHEAIGLVEGGLNQVRRMSIRPSKQVGKTQVPPYVDAQRILQLQSIRSGEWDMKRLIRLLQEVNIAHAHEMHMATAMLVRAVTDHVAPILQCKNFPEIANNYTAPRSFSDQMKQLDVALRKVADTHLHQQIRKSEVLPLAPQVDFRAALDVLLSEIVRVLQ